MFFNVKGIYWTLLAIVAVVCLCALDLHCSNRRDEQSASGAIDMVRREMAAGRHEAAVVNAERRNVLIRDMRVMVRRLLKQGRKAEARRLMGEIQKLRPAD